MSNIVYVAGDIMENFNFIHIAIIVVLAAGVIAGAAWHIHSLKKAANVAGKRYVRGLRRYRS